ncbi:MAG: cytidylate kinase family protein [Termitinemataceae bacterium]|nr:MAG: cytidylate kinase family protein [Termitinemataceae bacterium]
MAIITISRELAALGDEISVELAKQLNYRHVDKKTLEDRIKGYGINQQKLEKYDERKPSFFASLSQDRDEYLHYLKSAILAEAENGDCVFVGRGAFAIFGDMPAVISLFLTASHNTRIERVKSYFHCDEKRAGQIILQSDLDRRGFHKYFFDLIWTDSRNYNITLNSSYLAPKDCAEIIKNLISNTIDAEKNNLFKKRLKEMSLAQSIIHHVLYEKNIVIHFLEASVQENNVTLFGVANSKTVSDAAVNAAKELPSIQQVKSEIQVVHEYSLMASN